MSRVAAAVAAAKRRRPSEYCPVRGCLWYTGGGYCPRHQPRIQPSHERGNPS
jgi:hypothetical protein